MSTQTGTTARVAAIGLALLAALLLGGCAQRAATGGGTASSVAVAPAPPGTATDGTAKGSLGAPEGAASGYGGTAPAAAPADTGSNASGAPTKLIVVNKTIRMETNDVQAALARIRQLTATAHGDIQSMQVSTSVDQPVYPLASDTAVSSSAGESAVPLSAVVVVRVPSTGYASFVAEAAKLGRVLFQSESADDMTQQHVDMKARLGNLQAEQARLRQLFSRAKNVADMLAIEQELTRVQGDIESMQAQIAYLEKQAAMATVTLELKEPTPIVSPAGTDWGIATALTDAVRAFVNTMNGLIVLLGPVLALVIFVGLPAWLVVWLIRSALRRRRARTAPTPSPATPADEATE